MESSTQNLNSSLRAEQGDKIFLIEDHPKLETLDSVKTKKYMRVLSQTKI